MAFMRPTNRAISLTGGWLLLAVGTVYSAPLEMLWVLYGCVGGVVLVMDAVTLSFRRKLQLKREVNQNLPVSAWSDVRIEVINHAGRALHFSLYDHHPADFDVNRQPIPADLPKAQKAILHYRVRPLIRGDAFFAGINVLLDSALGLWRRPFFFAHKTAVKVYPNFAEISHYTLLAADNRLSQMGIRKRQRRGEGNDFYQLREYRAGDPLRRIDWRATSRYRKPISKEYQDERDQQIVFLLDCGRGMRHRDHQQAHLDHALNALLLLAYVAIRQGDAVGLLSFAGDTRWLPPVGGLSSVNRLLNSVYDLQTTTKAADYVSVARQLLTLQRRRALIILVTNSRTEDQFELRTALHLLRPKHLLVLADLREQILDTVVKQPVNTLSQALRFQATVDYLHQREAGHRLFGHLGAMVLDTTPKQLPGALVNQYIDIKRSGVL